MKALYLIFSHDHQPQLARMALAIRRLSPNAEIAVHHDPQVAPLNDGLFPADWCVHVVPEPVRGEWGDFSLVEQYLHAFRWSIEHLHFDWVITLTGLSYPVHPLRTFETMLAASAKDGFVYHFDADDPGHWPQGTAATRFQFRYFKLPKFKYWHRVPAPIRDGLQRSRVLLNTHQPFVRVAPRPRGLKTLVGLRRLSVPDAAGLRLQGGRQMLNITKDALLHVLRFVEENPGYDLWMRGSLIPDESYFTTILANAPELTIVNDVQRFIKWPREAHASSVAVITSDEIPDVLKSTAPFALKLDSRVDARALDLLDEHLRPHMTATPDVHVWS